MIEFTIAFRTKGLLISETLQPFCKKITKKITDFTLFRRINAGNKRFLVYYMLHMKTEGERGGGGGGKGNEIVKMKNLKLAWGILDESCFRTAQSTPLGDE